MTSIEHRNYGRGRSVILLKVAHVWNWWAGRRRRLNERRAIARLSDRMLRDIGIQHQIGANRGSILCDLPPIAAIVPLAAFSAS